MTTITVSNVADGWIILILMAGFLSVISTIRTAANRIVAAIQAGPIKKPEPPEQTFLGHYQPTPPPPTTPAPPPPDTTTQPSPWRAAGPAKKLPPRPLPDPPEDDERAKLRRRMNGY
jgi:hypothetical protein